MLDILRGGSLPDVDHEAQSRFLLAAHAQDDCVQPSKEMYLRPPLLALDLERTDTERTTGKKSADDQ